MNHSQIVNFLWKVADLIRDTFKRGKYQDVILPLVVLRRIDAVLEPTKEKVVARYAELHGRLKNLDPQLRRASGYAFYNTSSYTFQRLLQDPPNLAHNLRAYINGFSKNMREVLERFDFHNTINKLDEAGLLYLVMQRFAEADLHPDSVSNHQMGYLFEELVRRFNEALNENPGEHYTPREVIRLMVNLLLSQDQDMLMRNHIVRMVYDPCAGSGGMLTIAKEQITRLNPNAEIYLYGQEVNPETWAMSKADLYMKSADGRDAEQIALGSTLSNDQHADKHFDYLITNPPYGKNWRMDREAVLAEANLGYAGRFGAGVPRITDGQMLFLEHMLGRMKPPEKGGSRIAIVMNGSPLFTGDPGSGETEIRRWILENDWLEAIVALPEQLFYNTGIATYVWVLTNRKAPERRGFVQLIDATNCWVPMRRSLGQKRRQISAEQIDLITELCRGFKEGERVRIYPTSFFGYRKITVERPLRLNFQASADRIDRLKQERAFQRLTESKKRNPLARKREIEEGQVHQEAILRVLDAMPDTLFKDREPFRKALNNALRPDDLKISNPIRKAILSALSERDETAEICRDRKGQPEPDRELCDYERVPLSEDVDDYFQREVLPHVPDAWINRDIRDHKDDEVGKVGYEINFNRYFYQYQPPRPLEEIEADIEALQKDIMTMLTEVAR